MQESESNYQDKIWEWIQCTYDVKRISKETETTWNLSPSITLQLPTDNGSVEPVINLKIEQSRQFKYSEEVGWNWHKSWNLPDIGVELEIIDPTTDERLAPPNKIYAKIQIVKTAVSPMQTFHLLEVGVKGNQKVDLENGKCIFSGLKFNTTSYNHDHQKFHIVITLYLSQSKFEFPQILESRISPPIFVDSRKSARDITTQKKQKIQSYFDPFQPDILEKSFVKRDSKFKFTNEEEINNSVDGLINYFSAPNIRHKVKHPLFLACKFNQCVSLYINTNLIKYSNVIINNKIQNQQLIQNIQLVLQRSLPQLGSQKIDQKPLIICIDSQNTLNQNVAKQKKIMEFLDPFNNDSIQVMIDPVGIPKHFIQMENIADIQNAYSEVYDSLVGIRKNSEDQMHEGLADTKRDKKKRKSKEEEIQNPDKIRKIIQIQGPNLTQQKHQVKEVIKNAEKLMQESCKDDINVKLESDCKKDYPCNQQQWIMMTIQQLLQSQQKQL